MGGASEEKRSQPAEVKIPIIRDWYPPPILAANHSFFGTLGIDGGHSPE
jgi:hypothetical protein